MERRGHVDREREGAQCKCANDLEAAVAQRFKARHSAGAASCFEESLANNRWRITFVTSMIVTGVRDKRTEDRPFSQRVRDRVEYGPSGGQDNGADLQKPRNHERRQTNTDL